ncbi:ferrochelatase [Curvibacter sp. CHRR-16]|uniref:ferrochelatase n=1 Tax=Curvibacter sp. CHRR-16 TaxID=2835872 RepID=UPI001BD9F57C|nr:ferrochelatase [Curvibacter sp. CHRR-16]MBT0569261.1 ferrochelatase [Curvibacter sp. CHRR-16]
MTASLLAPRFAPEPAAPHGRHARTGLLLCNLGTPDAPTPSAVRRYLAEFLSDPRVVEIPKPLWWLILHGIILRVRPAKSAAKYASVWTEQGSPLRLSTEQQAQALQQQLSACGHDVVVRYAMRYGQPSIASQLDALKMEGCTRILLLPAYPQYSGTTTGSVVDAVAQWSQRTRTVPELRWINHYHDDPGYIAALAASVQAHWQQHGRAHLVMSFHGVPRRTLELGDPYYCECRKTARLLAQSLQLADSEYSVTFQSRLGRAEWLQPYTEPTVCQLAEQGVQRVDVMCPGFSCDCLETLEEINMEVREAFLHHGGKEYHYIPCLNADAQGMQALTQLCLQHLQGWPTQAGAQAAFKGPAPTTPV